MMITIQTTRIFFISPIENEKRRKRMKKKIKKNEISTFKFILFKIFPYLPDGWCLVHDYNVMIMPVMG